MRSITMLASAALLAACSTAAPSTTSSHASPSASSSSSTPSAPGSSATPDVPSSAKDASTPAAPAFAPEPDWDDGTSCATAPDIQTWTLDASTHVLRQSLCTHYEAPFMALLVGDDSALLVDTGTGDADVRSAVDGILGAKDVDLVVAHSHAHGDHVGGDSQFSGRPRTTFRQKTTVIQFSTIDLGNRIVDVIPIPGHEASHVAYYDRKTRLLFTGDTLYPGRLYVQSFTAYKASVARLVGFVDDGHPVSLVLGAHVELAASGTEFNAGAKTHPKEHALTLADSDLRDLYAATEKMTAPARVVGPNWIIVPTD